MHTAHARAACPCPPRRRPILRYYLLLHARSLAPAAAAVGADLRVSVASGAEPCCRQAGERLRPDRPLPQGPEAGTHSGRPLAPARLGLCLPARPCLAGHGGLVSSAGAEAVVAALGIEARYADLAPPWRYAVDPEGRSHYDPWVLKRGMDPMSTYGQGAVE